MAEYNETTTGGIIVNGLGNEFITHPMNPMIFCAPRGHDYFNFIYLNSDGGGVLVGGEANWSFTYGCLPEDGLVIGGETSPTGLTTAIPEGGIIIGGESIPVGSQTLPTEGGLVAGGESIPSGSTTYFPEDGILLGGHGAIEETIAVEGGIVAGGETIVSMVRAEHPEGGIVLGGENTNQMELNPEIPIELYPNGFKYRIACRIPKNTIDDDLTAFPVLVHLTLDTSHIETQKDIDFYDPDYNALPYEIENYNGSTGELFAWVKTDITATDETLIYCYYGKDQATTLEGNAWDSDFYSVYHLKESGNGTASEYEDAIANRHGTGGTGNYHPAAYTDKIYKCQKLDGNDYIYTTNDDLAATSDITVSGWIKISSVLDNGTIFNRGWNDTNGNGWNLVLGHNYENKPYAAIQTTNGSVWTIHELTGSVLSLNTWYHLALVWDSGNELNLFVNGQVVSSASIAATDLVPTGNRNYIGTQYSGGFVKGYLDEIRLSEAARSNAWIEAEYLLSDGNLVYGPEEIPFSISGVVEEDAIYNPTTSGGVRIAGVASLNSVPNPASAGGLLASGLASASKRTTVATSGGVQAGGTGDTPKIANPTVSGGVRIGGTNATEVEPGLVGGLKAGGNATVNSVKTLAVSGGLVVGGSGSISKRTTVAISGGARTGGSETPDNVFDLPTSGGVKVGGTFHKSKVVTINPTGGIKIGGLTRPSQVVTEPTQGGILASGLAVLSVRYRPGCFAGVVTGGSNHETKINNPQVFGGMKLGGQATQTNTFNPTATGGLVLSETCKFSLPRLLGEIITIGRFRGEVTNSGSNLKGQIIIYPRFGGDLNTT